VNKDTSIFFYDLNLTEEFLFTNKDILTFSILLHKIMFDCYMY